MAEIFGNTTTTPINPDLFGGGSGATSVASAILNTIEGGTDSITVNDVSPLAHSCSCRLESDNIYDFNENNIYAFELFPPNLNYVINDDGTIALNGTTDAFVTTRFEFYFNGLTKDKKYTFTLRSNQDVELRLDAFLLNGNAIFYPSTNPTVVTVPFEVTDEYGSYFAVVDVFDAEEIRNVENLILYPKLVEGEDITDFSGINVIVNGKYYPSSADGTVTNIASESPIMTITTDHRENVKVCDFTYCVDTKTYVDNNVPEVNLDEYVKNTDYATNSKAGVVKAGTGLAMASNGVMQIEYASEYNIKNKSGYRYPITPVFLDLAVKTGITTNTITLTEEEKAAAMEWLGITDAIAALKAELQG